MSRTITTIYEGRIKTLKRRRDFLDKRIGDYKGKDASRDKAESSALHWALGVIELHYEAAIDLIRAENQSKQAEEA